MTSEIRAEDPISDAELVARLTAGDAAAFRYVVTRYSPVLLHVARGFVSTRASAEEVVQEAWLAVVRSLEAFEGRSSLRTWIVGITVNLARRRGVQDARSVPWSTVVGDDSTGTVDPSRFRGPHDPYAGGWTPAGAPVAILPEQQVLAGESRAVLGDALAQLPERQRIVVTLRDVDGLSGEEVCEALGLTAGNQRILLHRGRSRLRQLLEDHYGRTEVLA